MLDLNKASDMLQPYVFGDVCPAQMELSGPDMLQPVSPEEHRELNGLSPLPMMRGSVSHYRIFRNSIVRFDTRPRGGDHEVPVEADAEPA